ncbi:putative mitochondrial protein, conserved [Ascosphaera acerosa]|nr:putative mitochondrial protein, conserved [Ascosphaera acerosa]
MHRLLPCVVALSSRAALCARSTTRLTMPTTPALAAARQLWTSPFLAKDKSPRPRKPDSTAPPPFAEQPAPPRLADPAEQAIYEELLAKSTGAFSTPLDARAGQEQTTGSADADSSHPDAVPRPPPEFAGERNPATGEMGGPKVEPLRWGGQGEWTYNGRATDF